MNPPDNYYIIELNTIDSTNLEAKRLIQNGSLSEDIVTVIIAKTQTGGRGRLDRKWVSHEGNLFTSVIVSDKFLTTSENTIAQYFPKTNHQRSLLPFAAAISIGETIKSFTETIPFYKWPNDVLVDGKKISGVLIETVNNYSIIGVGINIENYPKLDTKLPATCINEHSAPKVPIKNVLKLFLRNLDKILKYQHNQIISKWMQNAYGIGKNITIGQEGKQLSGVFIGIDSNGRLILQTNDSKREAVLFGDISFKN